MRNAVSMKASKPIFFKPLKIQVGSRPWDSVSYKGSSGAGYLGVF